MFRTSPEGMALALGSKDGDAVVVGAEGEDVLPGVAGVGGEMGVVSGLDGAVVLYISLETVEERRFDPKIQAKMIAINRLIINFESNTLKRLANLLVRQLFVALIPQQNHPLARGDEFSFVYSQASDYAFFGEF